MARDKATNASLELTESALKAACVRFPETVFMLGSRMPYLPERIVEVDRRMHLSMGNILDATPPVFLHVGGFHFATRLLTNGQYLQFLDWMEEDDGGEMRCVFNRADLWQHVWSGLNCQIQDVRMPYEPRMGQIDEFEESYADCMNFVEAYISSIRFEIERCLLGLEAEQADSQVDYNALMLRLFACIKFKLSESILEEDQDIHHLLSAEELAALEGYSDIKQILGDFDAIKAEVRRVYARRMDRRFRPAFEKGIHPIETLIFLDRIRGIVRGQGDDIQAPIALRDVLYPRYWRSKKGSHEKRFGGRNRIPWEELPLVGITLFEALAFCAWLSDLANVSVTLPNEAEFERASSWPLGNATDDGRIVIDPCRKVVFPWQEHNTKEFHYYFGQEGIENEKRATHRREYEALLQETSRIVGEEGGESREVCELEGFGWQWTLDRYSENERKYNRFDAALYPRFTDSPCVTPDGEPLTVYKYRVNENAGDSYFVLKGSPEVVGGPGMTTRRYAAYPFRGYKNVAVRWIIKDE